MTGSSRLAGALVVWTLMAAVSSGLAGCAAAPPPTGPSTTLTVFAAASLKDTFTTLGEDFEADHPGVAVRFSFAGSQALAQQLLEGATADVFASANRANLDIVTGAGLTVGEASSFATNTLTIAVPPGNPAGVTRFSDLARPGLKLVVCAPSVPCGAATVKLEEALGVTLSPVSHELAVTDVLAKVRAGEADAGLVYRTDVIAAGPSVIGIEFPEAMRAVNVNSVTVFKGGQETLAREFVALLLSDRGRKVLRDAGFGVSG